MPRRAVRPSMLAISCLSAGLAAIPAGAATSGWRFGKWQVVLAPAEDILVLAQDGDGLDVEVRSKGGGEIRFRFDTARCRGRGVGIQGAFALARPRWDGLSPQGRLQYLKDKFRGWTIEADAACPSRKHRLDLRKLDQALHQFDGQLAMTAP